MSWIITDLDATTIRITQVENDLRYDIPKFNITMYVEEPYLTIVWHKYQDTHTQRQLIIDYNDVTLPVVASATALETVLDGYILSGFTPTPQDEYFTITLNHGNTSPNDATAIYFGWRYGLGGEAAKFNNPAIVPFDCEIVKVDMSWRAATGSAAGDVRDFYVAVYTNAVPPVLVSDTIALSSNLVIGADLNGWAESGALTIAASAGDLIWMHYVGPYATNPINLLLTAMLTCKKT